jgi:hypothetical protein
MSSTTHPEWSKDNSLTTPSDRSSERPRSDVGAPPLTDAQVSDAMIALNNTSFTSRFPEVERRYADPAIDLQKIGLLSFVPAKGATPNAEGIYGFAKLRGNYGSDREADERAEYLIRNVDSYHQIYHCFVGRPFPLTQSSEYSKEVNRVDLQKATGDSIKDDVRKKREKEQKEIEEVKDREKELLKDVSKAPEENRDDHYTTLKVKKAQLVWTYSETAKKLQQMAGLIVKARREIEELDASHPELKDIYYQKYIDARRQAGLPIDQASADQSFMRYLVEDLHIPEVEAEYQRIYGGEEKQ